MFHSSIPFVQSKIESLIHKFIVLLKACIFLRIVHRVLLFILARRHLCDVLKYLGHFNMNCALLF